MIAKGAFVPFWIARKKAARVLGLPQTAMRTSVGRLFSSSSVDDFFRKGPRWSLKDLLDDPDTDSENGGSMADVDLERLADLAHLKIEDSDRPELEKDLHEILRMAALVQDATEGICDGEENMETTSVHSHKAPLRKDSVTSLDASKELMGNSSKTESGYFVVPNVS